ncbi:hypothetical protein H1C71_026482 [Ictidomys tridecemlineatus]|nr:hypothetical protein H1C71_026482 [Ictidomys tridecemlineatus]
MEIGSCNLQSSYDRPRDHIRDLSKHQPCIAFFQIVTPISSKPFFLLSPSMGDSTSLKQEKENHKLKEVEGPWEEKTAASPQDPDPQSSEPLEAEQAPETGPQPSKSPPWSPRSRTSMVLGDFTEPGALPPHSPPQQPSSTPPLTLGSRILEPHCSQTGPLV